VIAVGRPFKRTQTSRFMKTFLPFKSSLPPAQGALAPGHHLITALCLLASLFVFPLALLLFAQWPLREVVQAFSRQANDAGQLVFAFYVAVAITSASRARSHLASLHVDDVPSGSGTVTPCWPRWKQWVLLACTAPWCLFMLWAGWPIVMRSVQSLELFPETFTPGYFLIRIALLLMVGLILLDGALQLAARPTATTDRTE
jgi:TRAP-type mannitol/chloroaromatic compound transport system permease small subunit